MEFLGLDFWGFLIFVYFLYLIGKIHGIVSSRTRIISFWINADPKILTRDFKALINLKKIDLKAFSKLCFSITYIPSANSVFFNDDRICKRPYLAPLTYDSKIDDKLVEIKLGESKEKDKEIKFILIFRRRPFPKPALFTGYFTEEKFHFEEKVEKVFDFPVTLLGDPIFTGKIISSFYGFRYKREIIGPCGNTFEDYYPSWTDYSFNNKYVEIGYQDS